LLPPHRYYAAAIKATGRAKKLTFLSVIVSVPDLRGAHTSAVLLLLYRESIPRCPSLIT